jgi:hypothetical protein
MHFIRRTLWLLLAGTAACASDFTPYNEIDRFRVLAVGADHPWLAAGDETVIRALTLPTGSNTVSYAWSWCPLTQGANRGYQCAFTEAELQAQIDAMAPGAFDVPSFDLGTSSTAVFRYQLPPQFFAGACEALKEGNIPPFVELPACDGTFPITIRLAATSNGETIEVVKEIMLLYADLPLNTNPVITGLTVKGEGLELMTTSTTSRIELVRDREYTFQAEMPTSNIERYTFTPKDTMVPMEVEESLAITWFIDGGEMDSSRTGYIPMEVDLQRAGENFWTTPKAVDYAPVDARMILVVRDNRKGVSWFRRDFTLQVPQ